MLIYTRGGDASVSRLSEPIWCSRKLTLKSSEYGRKPVCWGALLGNHFSNRAGKNTHTLTHTNQLKDCTKSGQSLLRDRCRITSMRNLTMTLPPPPPPPPPPKQSLPLLPNYSWTLKTTSVTLKLKAREKKGLHYVDSAQISDYSSKQKKTKQTKKPMICKNTYLSDLKPSNEMITLWLCQ